MSFDFMDWLSSDILWQLVNFVQFENAKFEVIYDKLLWGLNQSGGLRKYRQSQQVLTIYNKRHLPVHLKLTNYHVICIMCAKTY